MMHVSPPVSAGARACIVNSGGQFSSALAARLRAELRGAQSVELTAGPVGGQLPPADVYLLLTGRVEESAARVVDALVHAWRRRLLPIALEHPRLRLGPLIEPAAGPCLTCYFDRVRQHGRNIGQVDALARFYRQHPEAEPTGYLPSMVTLAAEWARYILAAPGRHVGVVRHLDMVRLSVRRSQVIGVHNCPRCGLGADESSRSYQRLQPIVATALTGKGRT